MNFSLRCHLCQAGFPATAPWVCDKCLGPLEGTYEVNTYPESQLPSKTDVDAVLAWMQDKGYLKSEVTYNDLTVVSPKK